MKEIGGYFELELPQGKEYHKDAIRLNTGRNAFEYILMAKGYKKVYLPYYTCDVMLKPIKKLSLAFECYHIDEAFRPVFDYGKIKKQEVFVYTNYFGICDTQVSEVAARCKNLIIDNAQAFFSKPLPGVDTFYSPRKFFGLSDGAYLYTDKVLDEQFNSDISLKRFEHLLGRIDLDAQKFYKSFLKNDAALSLQPIKSMSALTQRILCSIDYEAALRKRQNNFFLLQEALIRRNKLSIDLHESSVPMVYPYLVENGAALKKKLIDKKIFVATYWPNVADWVNKDAVEYDFTQHMLPIPLDQRYGEPEMKLILEIIGKS
jgi:hypothetical protein